MIKNLRKRVRAVGLATALIALLNPFSSSAQTYCNPTYPNGGSSHGVTSVTIGAFTHSPTSSASNYTTVTGLNLTAGVATSTSLISIGFCGVGVAADFNSDGDFTDPDEILALPGYLASSPQTYAFNITIPPHVLTGAYRLRIWSRTANAGGANDGVVPCGTYGYGRFQDYTLNVTNTATCLAPSAVSVVPSTTSAAVSWVASTSTPASYEWKVVLPGEDPNVVSGVVSGSVATNNTTASPLTPLTLYSAYVRSTCSVTESSLWTLVSNFSTFCDGTPTGGTATTPAASVCPGISFNLSLSGHTTGQGISYQWQSSPATAGTYTNIASATSPTYSATQTVATDYRCIVTCASSTQSTASSVVTVSMNAANACYCTPTSTTATTYFISGFTTTGGTTNIANTGTSSGAYNNYSATMSASGIQGSTINFTIVTSSALSKRGVYLDWNQDGDFDDPGELVSTITYSTPNSTTVNGSFVVPYTALTGNTRMRIRNTVYTNTIAPCGNLSNGETEDYTFNTLPVTGVCVNPLNLATSGITNSTATVSFTPPPAGNTPTSYIYELRTDGTTVGSGAVGLAEANTVLGSPINFTNLAHGTSYTLFARTFCSVGDSSTWASISFSTTFDALTSVALNGFNADVIANGIGNATLSTNNNVDGAGYALVANDFKATASSSPPTQSLPMSRIVQNGLRKYMINSYSENNSLRMTGTVSGTIRFLAPKRANKVYVMGVSGSGTTTQTATVYFRDGSTQVAGQFFPDWFVSGNNVTSNNGRIQLSNNALGTGGPYLHDTAINIATSNRNKQIDSIVFAHTGAAAMNVLGVSIVPNNNQPCTLPAAYGVASNITSSGADVSWTGNGTNTNYQISYGLNGTFADNGTIVNIAGNAGVNTASLSGMSSAANQQVYFRTDCGAGSYSDWIGPITFTTLSSNCVGTPALATLTASATTVCSNTPYSLSVANVPTSNGIELKWQSSPAGANTWTTMNTVVPTVGTSTYNYSVATQSVSTDYRCVVSCTFSGDSSVTSVVTVAQNAFYNCYCTPTYTSGCSNGATIGSFSTTGSINNITNNSTGCTGPFTYYADKYVTAVQNTTVNFSVTAQSFAGGVRIWVDWNHNGIFEASEVMYSSASTIASGATATGSFIVPTTAMADTTRMRVRMVESNTGFEPCTSYSWGEAEDYLFIVVAQTACVGTPAPGSTISSVSNICVSGTSNLSLTNNYLTSSGISYQWQSSPDGSAWSDIANATAYNFTTPTITSTTHYRCAVTCNAGNLVGYSDPTTINVFALPTVTVTPSQTVFCNSGTATLLAAGAVSYAWTPATGLNVTSGASVDASPAGITVYTVTGTDANGCVNSANATVSPITALIPVATVNGSTNACVAGTSVGINVTPIASPSGTIEYQLTDNLANVVTPWQTSTSFTVTPTTDGAHAYNVYARNTDCPTSVSATPGLVTVYVGFTADVVTNSASCANNDGSIVVNNAVGPNGPSTPTWYANDFSTNTLVAAEAALGGVATITGGRLQLTPNTLSQKGGITILNPQGHAGDLASVEFKMTIAPAGADGLSYSFGNDVDYATSPAGVESGAGTKLILSFSSYASAGVYLKYNGVTLASNTSNNSLWINATDKPVKATISADNKLTLTIDGTTIFNQVQLPAAYGTSNKATWKQLIAARTGGISELHAIDDLVIKYKGSGVKYGASPANSGTAPTTWQDSPVFSGLAGGDSLDIWVGSLNNPATCNKFIGTYGVAAPVVTSLYEAENPSCVGTEDGYMILEVNAPGSYDVSYTKNGGSTITQSGIIAGNNGTIDFVYFELPQGTYDNVIVTSASACVSNTLGPVTLVGGDATGIVSSSYTTPATPQSGAGTQFYTDAGCALVAAVNSPNNLGDVTASVTVGSTTVAATNGEPFLGRYYEIEPTQNGTLPATLTLYFTPADFAAYNASALGSFPQLLADGSNLRITAFHGTPASGTTGPNGEYDLLNADLIQPSSVVLNSSNFYEVTFYSPNGFSGFFANTNTGTPLNIALGNITAKNEGTKNVIKWNSKTETAGNFFIVEQSNDGKAFKQIGRVAGKYVDNSNYELVDNKPNNGINYYRVAMMNVEGQKAYSNIVSVMVKTGSFDFNVFPNPVNNELSVKVSTVSGKGFVEVADVTGKIIRTKEIGANGTVSISMQDYASGLYLITYRDDVQVATLKVNKN